MVSVFFYCSSPYVGYTLKQADYVNREMKSASGESMTAMGYKLFNSSGSLMVLGEFEGRKYFHTRQSQSENYDEQGRRIYTNVAFTAQDSADAEIINKIALYVFFNEEDFYRRMADLIALLDDGFTVDFDRLSAFMAEIMNDAGFNLKPGGGNAGRFYNDVMKCRNKTLSFVVMESTWSYFVKQAGSDFNHSVLYKFSSGEAQTLVSGSKIELQEKKNDNKPVETQTAVSRSKTELQEKKNDNRPFQDISFSSSIFSGNGILICAAIGVVFIILLICIFQAIF